MTIQFANPMHPGEFLREEYLVPLNLSAGALAKALRLPRTRIERIAREEIGITVDTAIRLGRYFNTTPEFWMHFQTSWEIETTQKAMGAQIAEIEPRELNAA